MPPKKRWIMVSVCIAVGLACGSAHTYIPAETTVLTSQGNLPVEALCSLEYKIVSYDVKDDILEDQSLSCFSLHLCWATLRTITIRYLVSDESAEESIAYSSIVIGPQQKIYEVNTQNFIKAESLQPGDILLSKKRGKCVCDAIEEIPVHHMLSLHTLYLTKPERAYFLGDLELLAIR